MDYNDKLDRAYDRITEFGESDIRFEIPDPETSFDGSFTQYRNFRKTAQKLDRDEQEMLTFLQDSLATNGSLEDGVASFKGQFSTDDIHEYLLEYFETFVECDQCSSPDTQYEKQSGVEMIRCTACGATNPKPQ